MRTLPFIHSMPLPMFEEGDPPKDPPAGDPPPADPPPPKPSALNAGEDPPKNGPTDWPDDWRSKLAGEDADASKRLERFKAPTDIWKSYRELEARVSKGGGKPTEIPAPDGEKDPDGLKAWREERGIPEDATGYVVPDTVKEMVTDADKPIIEAFTASAHAKHMTPAAAQAAMEFFFETRDAQIAAELAADKEAAESTSDALRKEWGREFKPLSGAAAKLAAEISPGVNWFDARLDDGRLLANVPEVVKALADLALLKYGDTSYVGAEKAAKTESRKAEIQKVMREDFNAYQNDAAMQKEYGDILEAEEKRAARG